MTAMPSPAPLLSSLDNPHVHAAVALRERRERDRSGRTLIDGVRELRRALDSGIDIIEAFVCEALLAGPDARSTYDRLVAGPTTVYTTTERLIDRLTFGARSEGVVAVARIPPTGLDRLTAGPDALVVVIEGLEKPGNLGAILRSADGAGVDAVIAASPVADLYSPNTIRASAGTVFSVPLAAGPTADVLSWLRARRLRIIATRVEAGRRYTDVDLTGSVAVALGTESDGLTADWDADDIEPVSLPMHGTGDSLNVSVTAGVLLYEARRQRDLASADVRRE
jgi:RNA methyltransferase, TrmH family